MVPYHVVYIHKKKRFTVLGGWYLRISSPILIARRGLYNRAPFYDLQVTINPPIFHYPAAQKDTTMDMNYNFIIRNRPRKNGKPNYQLILSYWSKDGTWKQASKGGYALRFLAAFDKEKEKLLAKVRKTGDINTVFEGMTLAPNSTFTYRHHLASMTNLLVKPMVDITYAGVSRMINGMRNATSSIKGRVTLLKTFSEKRSAIMS